MKITIVKISNDSVPMTLNRTINRILINQIFSTHIYETNKHDKQDITQHHIIITFVAKSYKTQNYQPTQMQNEISFPCYLQKQTEITKTQLTKLSQIPNAAESLQMTMNPYLMGGSSISSNKPLMVITGADPEYSVEDYLKMQSPPIHF